MPFKRWDPLQDLLSLHNDIFGGAADLGLAKSRSAWSPAVDIYETEDSFVLKAEIPGMDPSKIKIEYRDQNLVISGEKPPYGRDASKRYHQVERTYGPFERRFYFPYLVCCDAIDAHYENGVIEVVVPKERGYGQKNIQVKG